jgi:hypothetical protein
MSNTDDLAAYGAEYLDRVLTAEHDGFVRAEEKVAKYAQALALVITTAALGAPHFQAVWTATMRSGGDRVYLFGYVAGALAVLVSVVAITASVMVEDTPGMPADAGTVDAFKRGTHADVLHQVIDRFATSIEQMRAVNQRKFRCVNVAMWATYATLVCALVALAGYALG